MRRFCRLFDGCARGGGNGDGLLWDIGLKPYASGDYSFAMVQANSSLEDQAQVFSSPTFSLFGVYDGHGGPEASRFISQTLFPLIQKFATEDGSFSAEVMRKAIGATEEEFLHLVKQYWSETPQIASVGSCCLIGAIANGILYVANAGDSRAVLGHRADAGRKKSPVVAERLSVDHNVGVEEVRKEVQALHPDDSHIVVYTHGVWRIKGIIQVSRSIGDVYLKKPEIIGDPRFRQYGLSTPLKRSVMTEEPSITIRNLKPQDLFLIFASDGLWEQLSDETAVEIVYKSPRAGIAKRLVRATIQEAARKREMPYNNLKEIKKGMRRHFHDDMTVIVVYLDHSKHHQDGRVGDESLFECTNSPVDIFSLNAGDADEALQSIT